MAITGPNSYPPTIALFLTHWDEANSELGAGGPLVLADGTDRAGLSALRDQLVTFASSIQSKTSDREIARGTININKASLLVRLGEFNRRVRGFLGHTAYENALPDVPSQTSGEGRILGPLDDCSTLWAKINAATIPNFTPPLLMPDGFAVATFDTDLAALKTAYSSYSDAEQSLKIEREKRNDVQDVAYAALRDYRAAVLGSFPAGHALVDSLPALTPAPGSMPDAVTLSGVWDAMTNEAVLTWNESTDPNLADYEIRMTPGPTYETENDTTIGSLVAGTTPLEFRTTDGLANPGDVASFKVYVVLTTVNEAGSNTVVITRP